MIKLKALFFSLLAVASAQAATTGQILMQEYNGSGFTPTYLTLGNGQVISRSAGTLGVVTLNAGAVGLGSVENTALSTWAGSTAVTTLGTITTGTWNGTAIGLGFIAQGGATSGQVMAWNGSTWAPANASGSSSLTVNTTTTSGASSGDILTSDGTKLQKLTPGTGVSTWIGTPSLANLNTALGVTLVTATSSAGISWTSADVGGLLATIHGYYGDIHIRQDGLASFIVDRDIISADAGLGTSAASGTRGGRIYAGETQNNLFFRFATGAHVWRVANTYSSDTNWEAAVMDWQTESNVLRIGSDAGSGGGAARNVKLVRGGATKVTIGANTTDHAQPVRLQNYAVADLPDPATCGRGSMAVVYDSGTQTPYNVVVGSGSYTVLVISDGVNWIVH